MNNIIFSRIIDHEVEGRKYLFTQKKTVLGLPFEVVVARLPENELNDLIIDGLPNEHGIEETSGLPMEAIWHGYRNTPEFIKKGPING